MRVIAGKYRGLKLKTIENEEIRPTLDRVKESVFNMIMNDAKTVSEGSFLDLFAGSGSIGIEAVSRGFSSVCMVEKKKEHIKIIKENTKRLEQGSFQLYQEDYKTALRRFYEEKALFDVIYLDPPFHRGLMKEAFLLLKQYPVYHENSLILFEHPIDEDFISDEMKPAVFKQKKYGKIMITIFRGINE